MFEGVQCGGEGGRGTPLEEWTIILKTVETIDDGGVATDQRQNEAATPYFLHVQTTILTDKLRPG